jgi:class 3 adenylate cyclase
MDLRVDPQADRDLSGPHDPVPAGPETREPRPKEQPFALLGFELRRVTRPNTKIVGDIAEVVLNRCVLATVEILTGRGAEIDVAGTPKRPVVEGRFEGRDSAKRAARAAVEVVAAVRKTQRAAENEFQVAGALTVGTATTAPNGALVVTGGTEALLARLRERAAPGQILLSAAAREATRDVAESIPARVAGTSAEAEPGSAFVLRGLK